VNGYGRVHLLVACQANIDAAGRAVQADALAETIVVALGVPPPVADPAVLEGYADRLARAAHTLEGEGATARSDARVALPQMWLGMTASGGAQALVAVGGELERIAATYRRAGDALASYA
jgi:hypothetical protein